MPKERHGVEQIIPKLRQADVELGKGKKVRASAHFGLVRQAEGLALLCCLC